jgi:type I restriction-modification system DNA methylase subunit
MHGGRGLMSADPYDLVSTADIARLAGEGRATVGNWKVRYAEFPPERGRSKRGPLYDRAEVTAWLRETGRLRRPPEVDALWGLAERLRNDMSMEEALGFILILLALALVDPVVFSDLAQRPADTIGTLQDLGGLVNEHFYFAGDLLPWLQISDSVMQEAVRTIAALDLGRRHAMADALLDHAAKRMGRRGGEYISPRAVRRLVVGLVGDVETIYNPGSGIGQLLIDLALKENDASRHLFGQEINSRVWAMSRLNVILHEVEAEIALGDIFSEDAFPSLRADCVVSIAPWNQVLPQLEGSRADPRWIWGDVGPTDGNSAWIQHCLFHAQDGGKVVLALPSNVMFEAGRGGRARQQLIKAGFLDAVISLPPRLFEWTALPSTVLVFVKGRPAVDGMPAPTLMIDVARRDDSLTQSGLDDDAIGEVVSQYHAWTRGKTVSGPGIAVASFDQLVANDFVIDPARYMGQGVEVDTTALRSEWEHLRQSLELERPDNEGAGLVLDRLAQESIPPAVSAYEDVRLSDLMGELDIMRGFPTTRTSPEGEIPVLSLADLRNQSPARHFATQEEAARLGLYGMQGGDVLVAIEGGTVGESYVLRQDRTDFVPSQQVAVLRVTTPERLDPWYLGAWMATDLARDNLRRLARGAGIQRIAVKDLESLLIRIPALPLQREVGERFRMIREEIDHARTRLTLAEKLAEIDVLLSFHTSEERRPTLTHSLKSNGNYS